MGQPLFSAEEAADWDARAKDASRVRAGDDIQHWENGTSNNRSIWPRQKEVSRSKNLARLEKMRARPNDVLNVLLVGFHERGSAHMTSEEIWEGGLVERLKNADTPGARRHVYEIIQGIQQAPRSWAKSATTRFFRGTGKQGKPPWSEKPGAGLLSKEHGWITRSADWFVSLFYSSYFFEGLFIANDSPDPYGDEAREIEDEGGNRWAATRTEQDDGFFQTLLQLLEARGMADAVTKPEVKKPKPRKTKQWAVGDKVTARNLRDLPEGAHLKMERASYPMDWRRTEKFLATVLVKEMVFVSRSTGRCHLCPIAEGTAFKQIDYNSTSLYKTSWQTQETCTIYQGQWEGPTLNVAIDHKDWGNSYKRTRYVVQSEGPSASNTATKEKPCSKKS